MARRKKQAEDSGFDPNGWMVTFSDLVTLLLTFFVMLISMSSMDTNLAQSFFTIFKGASGPLEFAEEGGGAVGVAAQVKQLQNVMLSPESMDQHELKEMLFGDKGTVQTESTADILQGEDIEVERSRSGMRILFKDRILFDAGTTELQPKTLPILDRLAPVIKYGRFRISVEGHTDDVPLRSDQFGDNWELSLARAIQVVNYFIQEHKLSANRFRVGGYGPSRPLLPNDTLENRQKNRRIEIFLYQND